MEEKHELIKRPSDPQGMERFVETIPPSSVYDDSDSEEEGRLGDYFRAIIKHLWLIIGIALLITLGAAIYMARKPDIYQAEARVQVNLENNPALGDAKSGTVVINNPTSDPAYFNTQLMILRSPALLQRVAKALELETNPAFFNPQSVRNNSTWQNLLRMIGRGPQNQNSAKQGTNNVPRAVSAPPATAQEEMAEAQRLAPYVGAIQRGLEVSLVEATRLINIQFSHPDPQITAQVVNAIADTYVAFNMERKKETNDYAGDFIQKRVAELQAQIRRGEEQLISYGNKNNILSLQPGQDTVVARLNDLNRRLLEAENARKMAEAAYRTAITPGTADALAEGTSPRAAAAEGQLASLRLRRAQLLVESGEEWPEVKELDKQIAELEKEVKEGREKAKTVLITKLETAYRQALAQEQAIKAAYESARAETLTQNEAAVNYRIIEQEIATNKNLLAQLLQRARENDVILAGTPNNIHVLDYAIVPREPVAPKRWEVVGMAFLFSLAFGVGTSILLEHLDNTNPIRSMNEVEKILRLPTLAAIPSAGGLVLRRKLSSLKTLGTGNGGSRNGLALLVNADFRSPLAEAYKMLRTSILLSAENAPKTLLVTSSLPGEGKTTTAINMALALAKTGADVLLIDADMRHPNLHAIFNLENEGGFSTILSNGMKSEDIHGMIRQDNDSGLFLLPSGPVPSNPSELLTTEKLRILIKSLESAFRYVIIDSPPIAYFTDAVLLSSAASGVLLVVHGSKSAREIVVDSQRLLQGAGAKIFGVVLNHVDLPRYEYHYYKRYYQNMSGAG